MDRQVTVTLTVEQVALLMRLASMKAGHDTAEGRAAHETWLALEQCAAWWNEPSDIDSILAAFRDARASKDFDDWEVQMNDAGEPIVVAWFCDSENEIHSRTFTVHTTEDGYTFTAQ
jgi:hypothetical protein